MQTPTPPTPPIPSMPPSPPTITPRVVGTTDAVQFDALQSQAAALVRQLAGLRVQRNYLERQQRDAVPNDAARAQLDANHANLDVQIAQAQADLDNVRAQIASRANVPLSRVTQGGQIILQDVPRGRGPRVDPDVAMGLSFCLLMAIVLPMSIAYARRIWRGKPQAPVSAADEIAPRLGRLEQAVDTIAIEVERISEGQRFVTKLLSERPRATASMPPRPDSVDGGIPDARQVLALGAGAAEPIRMAERQSVRQMNTPH
jgi:hypothetical protein